jgi:hypothetical protein
LFDEPVPTFGRFQVTAALGDGRFGPVHLGVDPQTDQVVVIRAFADTMPAEQQQRLVDALQKLCEQPLDHASIATPIACGLEGRVAYLTHSYLPGTSVDEFLRAHGPRPLAEVAIRVTHLAAALDFAAAAGVHHGALSPRDIIFAPQSTGVSGFGLVQAMREAGVDIASPGAADDIYALAAMTFELLVGYRFVGGSVRDALAPLRGAVGVEYETLVAALEPALSDDPSTWPSTALAFAASLHAAQTQARAVSTPRQAGTDVGRLSFGIEEPAGGAAPAAQPEPAAPAPKDAGSSEMRPVASAPLAVPDRTETPREPSPVRAETLSPPEPTIGPGHDVDLDQDEPEDEPQRAAESWHEPAARTFDAPLHATHDEPSARERLSEPLVLRPQERQEPPAAPVFMSTLESTSSGSGGRVIALGIGLVVLALVAVGVWMFARSSSPSSPAGAVDSTVSEPAERVEDRQPVQGDTAPQATAPSQPASAPASTPSATAPAAATPELPPIVQEEPTRQRAEKPAPRAEQTAPRAGPPPPGASAGQGREAAAASSHSRTPSKAEGSSSPGTHESAASASSRAAAAAATTTGRILVRSTPAGATVTVDGVPRGQTPAAIRELAFGSHVILVTAVGYPQWQQTITLTEDRPSQSFEVALEGAGATTTVPGSAGLQVDSRPAGAQVLVDGTRVGVTPLQLPTVAAGTHTIRIELPGFRPWATSVTVVSGQRTRVAASLEQ